MREIKAEGTVLFKSTLWNIYVSVGVFIKLIKNSTANNIEACLRLFSKININCAKTYANYLYFGLINQFHVLQILFVWLFFSKKTLASLKVPLKYILIEQCEWSIGHLQFGKFPQYFSLSIYLSAPSRLFPVTRS